jgi:hypothetical protein
LLRIVIFKNLDGMEKLLGYFDPPVGGEKQGS